MSVRAIRTAQNIPRHARQIDLIGDLPDHGGIKVKRGISVVRNADRNVVVNPKIIYVQTLEKLRECAENIGYSGACTVDTETRGTKWYLGKKAVSLNVYCPNVDRAYFIPVRMVHAVRNFEDYQIEEVFEDVLANENIKFVGHNFTFDRHFMRTTFNIEVAHFHHDTMLASRILNENESHDLESLCMRYLKASAWKMSMSAPFELWPIKIATQYAGSDAMWTWKLYEFQKFHLEKHAKLSTLFYDFEMPTAYKAYEMERNGVCFDNEYHETEVRPFIRSKKEEARSRIYALTGPINLEASGQVANAFFDMLGIPRINGNHVDIAVLSDLKKQGYVVADDLIDYRQYSTIEKMFVNKLPEHVVNGRIHCTFNTIGADTGRMSCKDPNLQQLPKRIGPIIRRAIVPSPGNVFVTMDYSQMELRLLAHFSEDAGLIQAFRDGIDIHTAVMCGVLGVSATEYEADKDRPEFVAARVKAKTVNFGVLYGMGARKLAWKLGIPEEEAKLFIDAYFARYPGIRKFINRCKLQAYKDGYVETIIGRKRRLPDAQSTDKMKSSMAEREAVNAPIQGSVADMMKIAALHHDDLIHEYRWPYELLLQIHDELLYEVSREWLSHNRQTLDVLRDAMANVIPLRVPVEVSVETLSRWGDKTILDEFEEEEIA